MTYRILKQSANTKHFNSHAHVERDMQADTFHDDLVISTHTLTWSVTVCQTRH